MKTRPKRGERVWLVDHDPSGRRLTVPAVVLRTPCPGHRVRLRVDPDWDVLAWLCRVFRDEADALNYRGE